MIFLEESLVSQKSLLEFISFLEELFVTRMDTSVDKDVGSEIQYKRKKLVVANDQRRKENC